jgi:hypothetical protein
MEMPDMNTRVSRKIGVALAAGAALLCVAAGSPSLQGPLGVTALSGQILDQQGNGLPGVQLLVGASNTVTDAQGRFLLPYVRPGHNILQIDGRHAGRPSAADYGFYEVGVEAAAGKTTVLPFTSWLPSIDHTRDITIPLPTTAPVVITTQALSGLALRIPAGLIVKDVDGNPVTRISITVMPKNRTPFPLPDWAVLPVFYTIQPGSACLYKTDGATGAAQIIYPNSQQELPGARMGYWRYDPSGRGWMVQGVGIVSQDGKQITPDADTFITNFNGSAECDPSTRTRRRPAQLSSQDLVRRLSQ